MIRADAIICGTTTTGTGTLTLAATPTPPGGVDFDVFARATGVGFGNSAAVLVSYTIIEYTDNTFATAKSHEKGIGTLTLGGSSGIANATLARTTKQSSATSLNSQPATQNIGSGMSIATAANTLVFIGASAVDVFATHPYVDLSNISCMDQYGIGPLDTAGTNSGSTGNLANNTFYYTPFIWLVPMLVKRATIRVTTAYSGGTPVSNVWGRLYAYNASGQVGKLLYDFGLFGSSNASVNSTGVVQTGASGNGYFLTPGEYWFCAAVTFSGGTTPPVLDSRPYVSTGRRGSATCAIGDLQPIRGMVAVGTPSSTPNDPADLSSYSYTNSPVAFLLKDS